MKLTFGAVVLLSSSVAFAAISVTPYYESPGTQQIGAAGKSLLCGTSASCFIGTENFNQQTTQSLSGYVSTFGNNGLISGTFTGNGAVLAADQYGGAGGSGAYLAVQVYHSETLTLNQGVNFFGLWFSALDATNSITFYQTGISTPAYTFGASQFETLVGNCPGTGFCGNPNSKFLGQNGSQQYAFLDFVSTGGLFNKVVISEGNSGNFEADNETVGYISDPHPTGTALAPEPGDLGMVIIGAGFLLGSFGMRRLRSN